ncbi:hypothetical protein, partial [Anaerovorax odorimutans]
MMTAHTVIVFLRYIMLANESRSTIDLRTIGGFFFQVCDEVADIRLSTSLKLIISTLKEILSAYSLISEEMTEQILSTFFSSIPQVWNQKLKLCA